MWGAEDAWKAEIPAEALTKVVELEQELERREKDGKDKQLQVGRT